MNKLSLSIVALVATLSLPAMAQTTPPAAAAKPTGTADQLRACLNTQDDIEARQKVLREQGEKLQKASEALGVQAKEINDEAQKVAEDMNATGSGRRARYERRERAYKQEAEALRSSQEKFNAERKKIEDDFTAFREKCANTAYLQDDIDKVKKEREAAGKK